MKIELRRIRNLVFCLIISTTLLISTVVISNTSEELNFEPDTVTFATPKINELLIDLQDSTNWELEVFDFWGDSTCLDGWYLTTLSDTAYFNHPEDGATSIVLRVMQLTFITKYLIFKGYLSGGWGFMKTGGAYPRYVVSFLILLSITVIFTPPACAELPVPNT